MTADREHDPVGGERSHIHPAAGLDQLVVGYEPLHDERTVSGQPIGDGGEAAGLVLRGREVEEGVEGHEHDGERAGREVMGAGHVPDHDGDPVTAGLGEEAGDHGRRDVDAADVEAGLGQWDGQATGAGAEARHATAGGGRVMAATEAAVLAHAPGAPHASARAAMASPYDGGS
jgi:hypothetical protein